MIKGKFRVAAAITVIAVALLVAACGSTSSSSSQASTSAAATSSSISSSARASTTATGVKVATTKGAQGTYLVGPSGRALYLWVADTSGTSSCSGACAKVWPPLITHGKPAAGSGVNAADLGTTTRTDGTMEVTYKGHPLYYYISDGAPGQTTGQGSDSFGAKWWLVAPSGQAITGSGSSSSAASSGSSGSSGGGGWG